LFHGTERRTLLPESFGVGWMAHRSMAHFGVGANTANHRAWTSTRAMHADQFGLVQYFKESCMATMLTS
jgi:hypothetical protein